MPIFTELHHAVSVLTCIAGGIHDSTSQCTGIPLGSFQPVEQPMTVKVKRNKFLVGSWASAVVAALSLMFFPGESLSAYGRCIRFINVPFVASHIRVPCWYKQAFASLYFGLLLLTIVLLFLARKYRKMERALAENC
jgi:hypothetical protein